jgi:hypothetical protein
MEERLRALPQPGVPAGLEARLLATIPKKSSIRWRPWAVCVGPGGALAAACLLLMLAWPGHNRLDPARSDGQSKTVHEVTPRSPADSARVAALSFARRDLDEAEPARFVWPLPETARTRVTLIPADLLN